MECSGFHDKIGSLMFRILKVSSKVHIIYHLLKHKDKQNITTFSWIGQPQFLESNYCHLMVPTNSAFILIWQVISRWSKASDQLTETDKWHRKGESCESSQPRLGKTEDWNTRKTGMYWPKPCHTTVGSHAIWRCCLPSIASMVFSDMALSVKMWKWDSNYPFNYCQLLMYR